MSQSPNQHARDFAGTSVASFLATAADGVVFALLITLAGSQTHLAGLLAAAAAVVGGIIHYSLCRFWIFERFDASFKRSIPLYVLMSASAAVAHGLATQFLVLAFTPAIAWFVSKAIVYVLWTYPASRYIVFAESKADV